MAPPVGQAFQPESDGDSNIRFLSTGPCAYGRICVGLFPTSMGAATVSLERLTYSSFTCTFRKRTLAPLGQAPVPPCTWKARCPLSFRTSSNFLSLVYWV